MVISRSSNILCPLLPLSSACSLTQICCTGFVQLNPAFPLQTIQNCTLEVIESIKAGSRQAASIVKMNEDQTTRKITSNIEPQPEPFAQISSASSDTDSQSSARSNVHSPMQHEIRGLRSAADDRSNWSGVSSHDQDDETSNCGASDTADGDEGSLHDQDDKTMTSRFVDRELSSPPDDEGMSTAFIDETLSSSLADETVQSEHSDGDETLFDDKLGQNFAEELTRTKDDIMHRRDRADQRAYLIPDAEKQLRESIAARERNKMDVLYEKLQADLMSKFLDDDKEFINNTRDQTPKVEVMRLKRDLIRERDDARKAREELDEWHDLDNQIMQQNHERRKQALQAKQRGKLHPPILGAHTRRPLYDNLTDKLRECTVHTVLNRAFDNFMFHDFPRSEYYAKRARDLYATLLDYKPLSAWCQFHVGKAQYGQRKYDEALSSFEEARKAIGLYVEKDLVEKWVRMTKESKMRKGDRGTSSAESGVEGVILGDQLEGDHDSTSSNGSRSSGESRPRQQSLAEQLGEQHDSASTGGSMSSAESGPPAVNLADQLEENYHSGSTDGSG